MAVGPKVSIYTLLVDKVALEGVAEIPDGSVAVGEPLGARTAFALDLEDVQYACLQAALPANSFLHCAMAIPPANESNKPDPGTIAPMPAGTVLSVQNRPGNPSLLVGDHVRISGQLWLVHDPNLQYIYEDDRKRSQTYLALQPFEWNKIEVIDDSSPQPGAVVEGSLALVVPLFQERYVEGWWPNERDRVDGHVYLADDGSNYVNELSTTLTLTAPTLPSGFTPDSTLLSWHEARMTNTTGQPLDQVRSVTLSNDGIQIRATVRAQPTGGQPIADPNNPVAFCATYQVNWKPRLSAPGTVSVEGRISQTRTFTVPVTNKGKEDLKIIQITVDNDPERVFVPQFDTHTRLLGQSDTNLSMIFAPKREGPFDATLHIWTDDPVGGPLSIALHGYCLLKVSRVALVLKRPWNPPNQFQEVALETPTTHVTGSNLDKLERIIVDFTTPVDFYSVRQGMNFIVKDPEGHLVAGEILPVLSQPGQPEGLSISWSPSNWDNRKFGTYSVTLVGDVILSGTGIPILPIRSRQGRRLDGEPTAFPSGDGEEGGSFTFSFEWVNSGF